MSRPRPSTRRPRSRAAAPGRHRRSSARARASRSPGARLAAAFPRLLGPGRRAAWRRFVLRRALALLLVLTGYALAVAVGQSTMWR